MKKILKKIGFVEQIIIGLVLGLLVGFLLNGHGGPVLGFVNYAGALYMNALKMMIYPMIFCTVIVGITEVGSIAVSGRIVLKAMIFFVVTTLIASTVGVVVPMLTNLGVGANLAIEAGEVAGGAITGVGDLIVGLVPANPFESFATGNVLQILVFAFVIGFAMMAIGEKAEPAKKFFISFNEVAMKVIGVVMKFTPVGVFLLMIPIVAENDFSAFKSIIWAVVLYYIVCIIFSIVILILPLRFMGHAKVFPFLKQVFPALMTAFSTRSSSATLPVSKQVMDDADIKREVSSVVLPLGSTMNMNGSAIVLLMMISFYCNACNVYLSPALMVSLITVCLLTSIGAPAIPNGGVAAFTALVVMAGLPGGVMAIFFSTCALTDMGCTAVNVLGDLVCCKILDYQERKKEQKAA